MTDATWMMIWLGSVLAGIIGIVAMIVRLGKMRVVTRIIREQIHLGMCLSLLGVAGGGTLAILQLISYGMNKDGIPFSVLSETGIFIAGAMWMWSFAAYMTGSYGKALTAICRRLHQSTKKGHQLKLMR